MRTLNDALAEITVGIQDAKADYPHLDEADIVPEVVRNVAAEYPAEIAMELFRLFGR